MSENFAISQPLGLEEKSENKMLNEIIELKEERISLEREAYETLKKLHDSFISKLIA